MAREKQRPPSPSAAAKRAVAQASGWEAFYRVVRRVPRGRVTTYGAIAAMAGHPHGARQVGYAMAALKDSGTDRRVPWHRVLGAAPRHRARVSISDPVGAVLQRALLEREGVVFDELGRVALEQFGWVPRRRT